MLNSELSDYSYTHEAENKQQSETLDKKYYSILPDLATGWRPKNLKIAAPILISYEDPLNQIVFMNSLAMMNKLIYIGPRHDNSYKYHSLTQHNYNIKYGIKCDEVPAKLQKQLEQFTLKSDKRKGLFVGMNPSLLEKQLQFQSNFQSGNLDLVVKVSSTQYNLFLRPDTNTRGHMQWFYFKINNQNYPHQKIKINICNNKKQGVLFCRGMKPYIYSKHLQITKGIKWQQGGQNISYKRLSEKQDFTSYFPKILQSGQPQILQKYFCLTFEYAFQTQNDEVYFSYCPPYTYSQMKSHIQLLKKKSLGDIGCAIQQQNLCTSLSGLQIPVLTISGDSSQETEKKCIIVTGRFHPGQSNGSYVLKGFMEYLISSQAEYLRKKLVFKIIPMINPDGVVFGNYRTSLSGKDLNRKFKAKNSELFPEIDYLKSFVLKLKKQGKMKLIYFLDFHGHSMKKNVFLYGPEYDIWSNKFQRSKILPKFIASKSNMFRYQSCLFRVAPTKKTTARAYMLGLIPYCYTIQSSVGLFRSFNCKQNFTFEPSKWQQMGKIIGDSLKDTILKIQKQGINNPKKKKKNIKLQQLQCKQNWNKTGIDIPIKQNSQTLNQKLKSRESQREKQKLKQVKKLKQIQKPKQQQRKIEKQMGDQKQKLQLLRSSSSKSLRQKQNNKFTVLPSQIFKNAKSPSTFLQFNFPQINQVDNQSDDNYSQGKSDCESDENDFDKEQYKKISGKIMKFIENFNLSIVGQRRKNFRLKNKKKPSVAKKKNLVCLQIRKISNESMQMVPSLKHKLLQRQLSEKRISPDSRQQSYSQSKKGSLYKFQDQKKKL